MQKWTVDTYSEGLTLQQFIKFQLGSRYSMRKIKRALEEGCCELNAHVERFGSKRLVNGDRIVWNEAIAKKKPLFNPKKILFNHPDFLAYNKPSGISCDAKGMESFPSSLKIVHRLDRQTSGVLLLAKNKRGAKALEKLFHGRKIEKRYLALVDGVVQKESGQISNYLGKVGHFQGQTLWGPVSPEEGKNAFTFWRMISRGDGASLLECFPETGRTHQIRVHLLGIGHPILGDYQYARKYQSRYRPKRLLLHAQKLNFIYNDQPIQVEALLPEEIIQAVQDLSL